MKAMKRIAAAVCAAAVAGLSLAGGVTSAKAQGLVGASDDSGNIYWTIDTVRVEAGSKTYLYINQTADDGVDTASFGLKGALLFSDETVGLLAAVEDYDKMKFVMNFGESSTVYTDDLFSAMEGEETEAVVLFAGAPTYEACEPSSKIFSLIFTMPDTDTVEETAQAYGLELQVDEETGEEYYEFPVQWGDRDAVSYGDAGGTTVVLPCFQYYDANKNDIFDQVELIDGAIQVVVGTVSDDSGETTTEAETTTTEEMTTTTEEEITTTEAPMTTIMITETETTTEAETTTGITTTTEEETTTYNYDTGTEATSTAEETTTSTYDTPIWTETTPTTTTTTTQGETTTTTEAETTTTEEEITAMTTMTETETTTAEETTTFATEETGSNTPTQTQATTTEETVTTEAAQDGDATATVTTMGNGDGDATVTTTDGNNDGDEPTATTTTDNNNGDEPTVTTTDNSDGDATVTTTTDNNNGGEPTTTTTTDNDGDVSQDGGDSDPNGNEDGSGEELPETGYPITTGTACAASLCVLTAGGVLFGVSRKKRGK